MNILLPNNHAAPLPLTPPRSKTRPIDSPHELHGPASVTKGLDISTLYKFVVTAVTVTVPWQSQNRDIQLRLTRMLLLV